MPRVTDSRERMLEVTRRLLKSQGYHGTGLNQIIEESQAPKGSLYHHFPGGKEQLCEEALRGAGREILAMLDQGLAAAPSVAEALAAYMVHLEKVLVASDFREGCPIAIVALETAALSETLQKACQEMCAAMVGILERHLKLEGRTDAEARSLAHLVFCSYEGALMMAQAQRDPKPLRDLMTALAPILRRL